MRAMGRRALTFAVAARRVNGVGNWHTPGHCPVPGTSVRHRWRTAVALDFGREHSRWEVGEVVHQEHSSVPTVPAQDHWTGRRPTGLLGCRVGVRLPSFVEPPPPSCVASTLCVSP